MFEDQQCIRITNRMLADIIDQLFECTELNTLQVQPDLPDPPANVENLVPLDQQVKEERQALQALQDNEVGQDPWVRLDNQDQVVNLALVDHVERVDHEESQDRPEHRVRKPSYLSTVKII